MLTAPAGYTYDKEHQQIQNHISISVEHEHILLIPAASQLGCVRICIPLRYYQLKSVWHTHTRLRVEENKQKFLSQVVFHEDYYMQESFSTNGLHGDIAEVSSYRSLGHDLNIFCRKCNWFTILKTTSSPKKQVEHWTPVGILSAIRWYPNFQFPPGL